MTRLFAAGLVLLASAAAEAGPRTWTVGPAGSDFPLIAPAIAAAQDGDVIEVGSGVYRENLVVGKRLSIVGRGSPILFGLGLGSVIRITADGCVVRGLAIEGSGTGEGNQMDAAIQIASSGNRIEHTTMRRVFYGVVIAGGAANEIVDNEITGFLDLPFGKRGDGIYVYRAGGNRIARNRIVGQRDGIYFQYAPEGVADGNTVSASRYGLHVMFSHGIVVRGNTFAGSSVGANIMDSRDIEVAGNRFERNRGPSAVGLTLKQCDDSAFRDNTFVDNARGLQVDGAARNRFLANSFRYNDTALTLFSSAEQNTFSGNIFDGNWNDVVLTGGDAGTAWNENGRGNQWSGYTGFDFDGDGIGDTPHPLLTPFAAIESANPMARLFLQTPVAAGLALAARAGLAPGRAEHDTHPVILTAGHRETDRETVTGGHGDSSRALAVVLLGLAIAVARGGASC